jgi:hypothetical protein
VGWARAVAQAKAAAMVQVDVKNAVRFMDIPCDKPGK